MCNKMFFLISFVLVLALAANTAVAELVAYYPLDEGSGESFTSSRAAATRVEVLSCP